MWLFWKNRDITNRFMANIWLFENMFWKYANNFAYNQKKEKYKRILYHVYGFHDIFDFFPPEIDEAKTNQILKTIFTYYDNSNNNEWDPKKLK